jgi:tRNA threonylcarbamoyladenosine biosynthesis protein TsaB
MLILAADTSTKSASVALVRDGAVLGETTLSLGRAHATTFVPALEELMRRCGVAHADLDAYACTTGPGSYTGIRIGLATVQMMAFAAGKPAYGASTLDALALPLRVSPALVVCPMIDARGGRVFASALPGAAGAQGTGAEAAVDEDRLVPEGNYPVEVFAERLAEALRTSPGATAVLCGDAAPLCADRLRALLPGADVRTAQGALLAPLASSAALLAAHRAAAGAPGDPAGLAASYLSPSQAEREAAARAPKP